MSIAEVNAEALIRYLELLRLMKKSVSDGVASSEGMNTLTGGEATPALMRISVSAGRKQEK